MSFNVELKFHPIFELLNSLHVYIQPSFYKKGELGERWRNETTKRISKELAEELQSKKNKQRSHLFEYIFGQELAGMTIEQVLNELDNTEEKKLVTFFEERLSPGEKWEPDLDLFHHSLELVKRWNEEYFRHIDPRILAALETDFLEKNELLRKEEPVDFVEKVTNGLILRDFQEVKKIVLYPVYHASPIITYSWYPLIQYYGYPVDLLPQSAEEPSPSLMRRGVALTDKNRLKILRYLVKGERSFTEIVQYIGLAKSTVHHHLISLRASGLVQVIISPESSDRYRLREEGLEQIFQDYHRFLLNE